MPKAGQEQKFRKALADYLDGLRKDDRSATATTYAPVLDGFLGIVNGRLSTPRGTVTAESRQAIEEYLDSLDARQLAPATRARNISACRDFLTYCMEEAQPPLLPWCPIDALGLRRPKKIKSDPGRRTMIPGELESVFSASQRLGEKEHATVWLLATTGIRVSELCRARWLDLRLDPVTGRIALHVESLKHGQDRDVEIVPALFELLAKLHGSNRLSNKDSRPLLSYNHTKFYSRSGIWRMLERVLVEAGIDRDVRNISALWFRHTTFSYEARGQATAYQIRKQAGHQRIETSQHYVDLGRGLLDSPTHLLPDYLLGEGYSKPEAQ